MRCWPRFAARGGHSRPGSAGPQERVHRAGSAFRKDPLRGAHGPPARGAPAAARQGPGSATAQGGAALLYLYLQQHAGAEPGCDPTAGPDEGWPALLPDKALLAKHLLVPYILASSGEEEESEGEEAELVAASSDDE